MVTDRLAPGIRFQTVLPSEIDRKWVDWLTLSSYLASNDLRMTTCQSQKNITCKGCPIDDDDSLYPERNKINMLKADDSERARIPV